MERYWNCRYFSGIAFQGAAKPEAEVENIMHDETFPTPPEKIQKITRNNVIRFFRYGCTVKLGVERKLRDVGQYYLPSTISESSSGIEIRRDTLTTISSGIGI